MYEVTSETGQRKLLVGWEPPPALFTLPYGYHGGTVLEFDLKRVKGHTHAVQERLLACTTGRLAGSQGGLSERRRHCVNCGAACPERTAMRFGALGQRQGCQRCGVSRKCSRNPSQRRMAYPRRASFLVAEFCGLQACTAACELESPTACRAQRHLHDCRRPRGAGLQMQRPAASGACWARCRSAHPDTATRGVSSATGAPPDCPTPATSATRCQTANAPVGAGGCCREPDDARTGAALLGEPVSRSGRDRSRCRSSRLYGCDSAGIIKRQRVAV